LSTNSPCWSSTSMLSSIVCDKRAMLACFSKLVFFFLSFGSGNGRRVHCSDSPVLETAEGFIVQIRRVIIWV
jgi:hypothetical protein